LERKRTQNTKKTAFGLAGGTCWTTLVKKKTGTEMRRGANPTQLGAAAPGERAYLGPKGVRIEKNTRKKQKSWGFAESGGLGTGHIAKSAEKKYKETHLPCGTQKTRNWPTSKRQVQHRGGGNHTRNERKTTHPPPSKRSRIPHLNPGKNTHTAAAQLAGPKRKEKYQLLNGYRMSMSELHGKVNTLDRKKRKPPSMVAGR